MMKISHNDYEKIIQAQSDRKLTIMIDVAPWRQILSKIDPNVMESLVKFPVRNQIAMIRWLSRIDLLPLIVCVSFSIPAFKWWSIAVGPLIVITSLFFKSRVCYGKQNLIGAIDFLLLIIMISFLKTSWALSAFIISAQISFFQIRFLYYYTSRFVFNLTDSSYEFFSEFYLQPAEKIGSTVIPLIWTMPEYKQTSQ